MLHFTNYLSKHVLKKKEFTSNITLRFSFNGLEPLFKKKSAWVGKRQLINSDIINPMLLDGQYCCNYDVVWIYEQELFSYYNWPQILFKSLSILNMKGNLVLRIKNSKLITLEKLKIIFNKLSFLDVEIKNQFVLINGTICTNFFIIKKHKNISVKKDEFFLLVDSYYTSHKKLFYKLLQFVKEKSSLLEITLKYIRKNVGIRRDIYLIKLTFYMCCFIVDNIINRKIKK